MAFTQKNADRKITFSILLPPCTSYREMFTEEPHYFSILMGVSQKVFSDPTTRSIRNWQFLIFGPKPVEGVVQSINVYKKTPSEIEKYLNKRAFFRLDDRGSRKMGN